MQININSNKNTRHYKHTLQSKRSVQQEERTKKLTKLKTLLSTLVQSHEHKHTRDTGSNETAKQNKLQWKTKHGLGTTRNTIQTLVEGKPQQ